MIKWPQLGVKIRAPVYVDTEKKKKEAQFFISQLSLPLETGWSDHGIVYPSFYAFCILTTSELDKRVHRIYFHLLYKCHQVKCLCLFMMIQLTSEYGQWEWGRRKTEQRAEREREREKKLFHLQHHAIFISSIIVITFHCPHLLKDFLMALLLFFPLIFAPIMQCVNMFTFFSSSERSANNNYSKRRKNPCFALTKETHAYVNVEMKICCCFRCY